MPPTYSPLLSRFVGTATESGSQMWSLFIQERETQEFSSRDSFAMVSLSRMRIMIEEIDFLNMTENKERVWVIEFKQKEIVLPNTPMGKIQDRKKHRTGKKDKKKSKKDKKEKEKKEKKNEELIAKAKENLKETNLKKVEEVRTRGPQYKGPCIHVSDYDIDPKYQTRVCNNRSIGSNTSYPHIHDVQCNEWESKWELCDVIVPGGQPDPSDEAAMATYRAAMNIENTDYAQTTDAIGPIGNNKNCVSKSKSDAVSKCSCNYQLCHYTSCNYRQNSFYSFIPLLISSL